MNVLGRIRAKHAALLELPSPLKPSEWAEKYRYLSREAHSKGGKYHNWPFQVEPLDELINPDVRGIVLQWASQLTGKTETMNNATGYFIQHRPRPILNIQYSLDMADVWAKDRLGPMLRDTPVLRGLVRDSKSRLDGEMSTMRVKVFPGGRLAIVGSESAGGLASRPIGFLQGDEADKWKPSASSQGDPWAQALVRLESFADAVWMLASSPTFKNKSRIEKEMEDTDKRMWFVPCPIYECDHWFVMQWQDIRWEDGDTQNAWLECPKCHSRLSDEMRVEMIHKGEWRATAPFRGVRGYFLNGIVTLLKPGKGFKTRLHQMAEAFLTAKRKGPLHLQVWHNLFKAETWEEELDKPEPAETIYARRENYTILPERCVVLAAGVDVQADRIEAEISGWGEGEESWGVEYRVFRGNVTNWQVWNELDQFIQSKFRHVSGHDLQPSMVAIDAGHAGKMVYAFANRCAPRAVIAVRGTGTNGMPWVIGSKRRHRLKMARVNEAKVMIYSRLKIVDHGPGYTHFPETYTLEYFQQLTSERMSIRYIGGVPQRKFTQNGRNEALDCRVYAMAGIEVLRPNYRKLAAKLKLPPGEIKTAELSPQEQAELQRKLTPVVPKISQTHKIPRKPSGWMRM